MTSPTSDGDHRSDLPASDASVRVPVVSGLVAAFMSAAMVQTWKAPSAPILAPAFLGELCGAASGVVLLAALLGVPVAALLARVARRPVAPAAANAFGVLAIIIALAMVFGAWLSP